MAEKVRLLRDVCVCVCVCVCVHKNHTHTSHQDTGLKREDCSVVLVCWVDRRGVVVVPMSCEGLLGSK